MSRYLAIAGVKMNVARGQDNSKAMMARLKTVSILFPWVDMVIFSELCSSGLSSEPAQGIPNSTIDEFCKWAAREKKEGSFYQGCIQKFLSAIVSYTPIQRAGR